METHVKFPGPDTLTKTDLTHTRNMKFIDFDDAKIRISAIEAVSAENDYQYHYVVVTTAGGKFTELFDRNEHSQFKSRLAKVKKLLK